MTSDICAALHKSLDARPATKKTMQKRSNVTHSLAMEWKLVLVLPPPPHTTPTPIHIPLKVNCAARTLSRSFIHFLVAVFTISIPLWFDVWPGDLAPERAQQLCHNVCVCVCVSYRRVSIAMHLSSANHKEFTWKYHFRKPVSPFFLLRTKLCWSCAFGSARPPAIAVTSTFLVRLQYLTHFHIYASCSGQTCTYRIYSQMRQQCGGPSGRWHCEAQMCVYAPKWQSIGHKMKWMPRRSHFAYMKLPISISAAQRANEATGDYSDKTGKKTERRECRRRAMPLLYYYYWKLNK